MTLPSLAALYGGFGGYSSDLGADLGGDLGDLGADFGGDFGDLECRIWSAGFGVWDLEILEGIIGTLVIIDTELIINGDHVSIKSCLNKHS